MAINFTSIWNGLKIKAKAVLTSDTVGEIETSSVDNKTYLHNGTIRSPILTEDSAAVIENKDLVDSTTNIVDNTDPTIRINFDAAGTASTRTTVEAVQTVDRTITLPDATDTLVGKATTDTLTNKSLSDTTTSIVDATDPTIQVKIDAAGSTATSTTITSSQTVDQVITLPDATDTLIGKATTDTLTNKTIDANGVGNSISNLEVADLAAGVLNTSVTMTGASDTQVPSALAIKTYVDNSIGSTQTDVDDLITLSGVPANSVDLGTFTGTTITDDQTIKGALQDLETTLDSHIADTTDAHDASAISASTAGVTGTDVQANLTDLKAQIDTKGTGTGDVNGPASATDNAIARFDLTTGKLLQDSVVTVSDTGVITGASIDADVNTITNIENADIKTGAAIDRTKLASGTNYRLLANSATGVMSENAALTATRIPIVDTNGQLTDSSDLTVTTNAVTLANTKHLEIQADTDSTTTGSNASLTAFTAGAIRLTNASLASLANIPAGTNGQDLTIFNRTGVDITVSDSSAAVGTAANRILTGTNGTITFSNNAALSLKYDSTTSRWQIVGGTGSGTGGSTALDTILQLTASEQLTDWSTGDNATFLGGGTLSGTFVKETTTPLHGTASYKYTQAAGSLDDYLASAVFPVDLRFRGQQVYFSAPIQYDGNTGDIQIVIYDVTNATVLTTLSNSIIGTNGATQTVIASALLPLTCANIRVGFQVKVLNSGKILSFDDIQVGQSLYQAAQLNNVTDWQDAGLVAADFQGFGTPTAIQIQSRREGGDLLVRGKFTSGTPTAVETRVNLKLNGVALTSANSISIPSIQVVGKGNTNIAAGTNFGGASVLIEPSSTYMTFGGENSTLNGLSKIVGNALVGVGSLFSFNARIPIAGWSAGNTAIVTPTQQISSDTLPFTFKATAIVDADPIGTFNTYTYAANTNTATISASAPTQTVASMNADGFRVFARAYNAASTTASPARVDIKIGKGLKAEEVNAYGALAKATMATYNYIQASTTTQYGALVTYDEVLGILRIDAGRAFNTNTTIALIGSAGGVDISSAYFVFNASTTPSIAALPILQPRIATLSDVKASGTAGGNNVTGFQTRTLNTLVDPTGIVTSLSANQVTLPAGTYMIEASCPNQFAGISKARFRNITDSATALGGTSEFSNNGSAYATNRSFINGEITISSPKIFELQHYLGVVQTGGLGSAASSGETEVYSTLKITKIR